MKRESTKPKILEHFKRSNYDACKDWGAKEWLLALSERAAVRHFLRNLKGGLAKSSLPTPIFTNERHFFRKEAERRLVAPTNISDNTPYAIAPVVLSAYSSSDLAKRFESVLALANERATKGEAISFLADFVKQHFSSDRDCYLSINLDAPDSIIRKKFENFIQKAREVSGVSPLYPQRIFVEHDFVRWRSQQLLPYLDLVFWAKMNDYPMKQDEIGERLFPNLDDARDRVRSLPKNALKLISREYLHALATEMQTF